MMGEAVQFIVVILFEIFDMFTVIMFYNTCFGRKNARVRKAVFYAVFVSVYAIGLILSQLDIGLFHMLHSALAFFILTYLYDAKILMKIFTAFSIMTFAVISELIGYGVIMRVMADAPEDIIPQYSLILAKLITFIMVVIVTIIVRKNTHTVKSKEYLCFIATSLISIAIIVTISFEADTNSLNASREISLAAAGLMIINIITFYFLENIIEATQIREQQSRMEQQFIFQEQKYEQTSRSFKSIGSVIHDTNKHLIYLNECIDRGEYAEAKRYINTAIEHIDRSYKRINTGYLPVDALVSNALDISELNNITFKSDIKIEKERINIERYDFCVALGNLLDNAVEAVQKVINPDDRMISVSIVTADNSLIINIENSVKRMSDTDFKTDKNNDLLHGYGISNVRAIAEKYGGVFTLEHRESSCEATVILPI